MVAAGVTFAQIGTSTPGLASSSLAASVSTSSTGLNSSAGLNLASQQSAPSTSRVHTASVSTSAKHSISGSNEEDD